MFDIQQKLKNIKNIEICKAELPLTVEEVTDAVIQNADNPTMIRLRMLRN